MSAPDTNIERQKKRHKPAIWGLWTGAAIVAAAGLGALIYFA